MLDKLKKLIEQGTGLTHNEIGFLEKFIVINYYSRGEIIKDFLPSNIYLLLNGYIRVFYCLNSKEITVYFYEEGDIIYYDGGIKKNDENKKLYEAIDDLYIIELNKDKIKLIINEIPGFEMLINNGREKELLTYQRLIEDFITLTPEERFINLLQKKRELFLHSPQQYIASYIGVSAETLSRIKKRIYSRQKLVIC